MSIATGTAIAIGASAAASIASAKIASNAAKNAAKTQSDAADKARTFAAQQYQQQRQDFNPYAQAGQASLGRLGAMANQQAPVFQPGQPQSFASLGNPMGGYQPPMPGMAPNQTPANHYDAPLQGSSPMVPQGQPGMQGPPPPQGQQMVMMVGPDGSRRPVPANLVAQFQSRGARVISA